MKRAIVFLVFLIYSAMFVSAQSNPLPAGTQRFAVAEQVDNKFLYEGQSFEKIRIYGYWPTMSGGPLEFDAKQDSLTYFDSDDGAVMQFKTKDGRLYEIRLRSVRAISAEGNRLQFF